MRIGAAREPAPPLWKQAVVSGLAIFPISLAGNGVLGPLLLSAPLLVRTLVFTVLFSAAMTFVAIPVWNRILFRWLHPATRVGERTP
ncbi:hypothetical protein JK358_33165 [Nocardia sp. 2]|uniref:Membrane transport protein MMPL domain-containing protein n=1 Tax=Nocardia acididurans TaxID=2802282 RepID=A0ABS1MJ63_9NOCA|nr:hypothetical protein [Nocardia acididurans]MBL1079268.1 hypothetical protein [Nocardia acididurans]